MALFRMSYEDLLLKKMQPQGVVFLSILVLEGPDIVKFIAPQNFIDSYLKDRLYNDDPTLILHQDAIGFYKWSRFIGGEAITTFIKENFKALECESLVACIDKKRLVLTVGYKGEFSLASWFFKEKPMLDQLFDSKMEI